MTLDRFTGNWRNTWVRVGMQQTPFIDGEESVYRYRFQGTLFAERDGGLSWPTTASRSTRTCRTTTAMSTPVSTTVRATRVPNRTTRRP